MVIDFHTHVFPDKIAAKTIEKLSVGGTVPPFADGTARGLIKAMDAAGVDVAVALPVLTNPLKFESVNGYADEINREFMEKERRIISFAGIHPECEDIGKKMAFIKEAGFLGIKIHPDYQNTYIDDEKYVKILQYAKEYDLIVVSHAGVDVGYPERVHCTPDRALNLIRKVPYTKLVLAHLGAAFMTDEVIDKLCGEGVYFDTGYVLRFVGEEKFKTIVEKHGADRILFATDSPWSDIKGDVEIIRAYGLDKTTENKILYENAKALLGL